MSSRTFARPYPDRSPPVTASSSRPGWPISVTSTGNAVGSSAVAERYEISGDSYGIRVVSTSTVNLSNNIVNNFTTAPGVPTGEFYFGISVEGTGGAHTVVNNTVTNVTNGSTPDSSFNTQTIGLIDQATGIQTIRGNTVSNIGSTGLNRRGHP